MLKPSLSQVPMPGTLMRPPPESQLAGEHDQSIGSRIDEIKEEVRLGPALCIKSLCKIQQRLDDGMHLFGGFTSGFHL